MGVLGKQFSPVFDTYYEEAVGVLKRPIKFMPITGQVAVSHEGYANLTDGELVVELNVDQPDDICELIVAHEIGHGLLIVEGFPRLAFGARTNPNEQQHLTALSNVVSSALSDCLIDERLVQRGFPMERRLVQQLDATEASFTGPTDQVWPRRSVNDQLQRAVLALFLLESTSKTAPRIYKIYGRYRPRMLDDMLSVVKKIRRVGWRTPEKMEHSLRILRDALGLKGVLFTYDSFGNMS